MMIRCTECAGGGEAVDDRDVVSVTISHARSRKPNPPISERISSGVRRKLDDSSSAHMIGK